MLSNSVIIASGSSAVLRKLVKQADPFKSVYTGVDVTRKRALSVEILHRIITMDIPEPDLAWSRDLFIFSFQARGINPLHPPENRPGTGRGRGTLDAGDT